LCAAAQRSSLPFRLTPIHRDNTAPQAACFHRFCTIAELNLDEPFGHDDTQTRFHAHSWQTVQLSGHQGRLAVVAEPPSHVCLSAEENGRFDTSKYVVATNDLRKCLNYERLASSLVPDVHACDGDDNMIANAPTMTTPPSIPKQCKYGPHSRPRDEMEAEGNVGLDARQGGENNVRPLFSQLSSTHCPMPHSPLRPNRTCV
jgi:hypothetical protein